MVAGYLASAFQWSRFSEQWDKLLRQWKMPVDDRYRLRLAHRSDVQHRKGPFRGWTESDRDRFLQKAYAIIRCHTKIPIANAVTRKTFETIALKRMQKVMTGVYGWCTYTYLHQVKQYCDHCGHKEPGDIIFEQGAQNWGQVRQLFRYLDQHQQLREFYRLGTLSCH